MTLTLGMVTFDSSDAGPLAAWWAEQTGGTVADPFDGTFLLVQGGSLPLMLAFQAVEDPTPGKNRVHLDLHAPELATEVRRLVAAGATVVAERGDESFRWVTLTDPQGNQFCVSSSADAESELAS